MASEIERALNSVGKACFIRYYKIFADENYSNTEIAIILSDENGYTDKACQTRTSKARTIIKNGWTCPALELIQSSSRLAPSVRMASQEIFNELCLEPK